MAVVFEDAAGQVVRVPATSAFLESTDLIVGQGGIETLDFDSQKSLITAVTASEKTSFSLSHSFGKLINLFVYGDRVGQATIGGISFAKVNANDERPHGIVLIRDYYHANKLSNPNKIAPIFIYIGGSQTPLRGLITGFDLRMVQVETRIFEWNLSMLLLPE